MKLFKIKSYFTGLLLLMMAMVACTKIDDYKLNYLKNGSTIYPGKLDSIKVFSGKNRVLLTGLFTSDPNIVKYRVFWNNKQDSLEVPVKRSSSIDTAKVIIDGLPEGMMSFEIRTYDVQGNISIPVNVVGDVFGNLYQGSLQNRAITNSEMSNNNSAVIQWGDVNSNSGVVGLQIQYTDVHNTFRDTTLGSNIKGFTTLLPDYKAGTKFKYRTLFKPKASAIDTFYTNFTDAGVKAEITSQYLKNPGNPFHYSTSDGRWQILADWFTSDDVKNAWGFGGLDAAFWLPSPALSMEAGWGLPAVPNGKIYQTITLPAGKYLFEAVTGDASDGGLKFLSVAKGTSLPDIENISTEAIKYTPISRWGTNQLKFELTEASEVSIGFQANLPNPTPGTFFKVFSVNLFSLP